MSGAGGRDPLAWVAEALAELDRAGLRRPTRVCRVLPGGRVEVDGRELWNFGGNDYLGLASDPDGSRDRQGAPGTSDRSGATALPDGRGSRASATGATASPAVIGRSPEIAELERTLAEFEGTEDAVVFPTGYAANLGTVAALTGPGDAVFVERDCHACLVDGAKLGGGRLRVWRRDDPRRLERELAKAADARRRWIVTEWTFSMDGDGQASREPTEAAADRYDAMIVRDHAHAVAPGGRPRPRVVKTGTLSKAVGAAGGYVVGSRALCDFLRHAAKSYIYSTALPPSVAAAATRNLDRIRAAPERIVPLGLGCELLRTRLRNAGLDTRGDATCPIVPVIVGGPDAAVRASAALAEAGFFVPAIRPPTVPRGTSRLRISLSLAHPTEAVDAPRRRPDPHPEGRGLSDAVPDHIRAGFPTGAKFERFAPPVGDGEATMSYVEAGSGSPVLFVHGNPTWSWMFRGAMAALAGSHRCVAVDHVGMGRSDKPADYAYRLDRHAENLLALVRHLDLTGITLVVHDWGGPIGLLAAVREPGRFSKLVISNTAAFRSDRMPWQIGLARSPVGGLLVRGPNLFVRGLMRQGVVDPAKITPEARRGYLWPYGSWADRVALHRFVQDVPTTPDHPSWPHLEEVEEGIVVADGQADPAAVGRAGLVLRAAVSGRSSRRRMPWAETVALPAGHLVMEDEPGRYAEALTTFACVATCVPHVV